MHITMLTGHREVDRINTIGIMLKFVAFVKAYHPDLCLISGGAIGADQCWAAVGFSRKISYDIYVPQGYVEHYQIFEKEPSYKGLYGASQCIFYTSTLPIDGVFDWRTNFKRNEKMVQDADSHVVCSPYTPKELLTHARGGTAACVKSMAKAGLENVWHINPEAETFEYVSLV